MVREAEEDRPIGKSRSVRGPAKAVDELAEVESADRSHKRVARAARTGRVEPASPRKGASSGGGLPKRRAATATSAIKDSKSRSRR
jgi:hypothetical protein